MSLYDITIGHLINIGFYDIAIPFFILFIIFYKTLTRPFKRINTKKDDDTTTVAIISLTCSFFVLASGKGTNLFSGFLTTYFGKIGMILITILILTLSYLEIKKIYKQNKSKNKKK